MNISLFTIYMSQLQGKKDTAALEFEQKIKEEHFQSYLLLDLINKEFINSNYIDINEIGNYIENLKPLLNPDILAYTYIAVIDVDGNEIYESKKINLKKYPLAHREYFNVSKRLPNIIHVGYPIIGGVSKKKIIPMSKAITCNDKVNSVITILINIDKIIQNISSAAPFAVNLKFEDGNGAESNPELRNFVFPNFKDEESRTLNYSINIKYDYNFLINFLKVILPWNILFTIGTFLLLYINKLGNKLQLLGGKFIKLLKSYKEQNLTYKINSDQFKKNLLKVIEHTNATEYELENLDKEIEGLLRDKSINLNDEYIKTLEEFKNTSKDNRIYYKEFTEFLKLSINEIRTKKCQIDIDGILILLKNDFKVSSIPIGKYNIEIFEQSFEKLMKTIKNYYYNLCPLYKPVVEFNTNALKNTFIIVFSCSYSSEIEFAITNDLLINKIILLSQFNGFKLEINNDSSTKSILKFEINLMNEKSSLNEDLATSKPALNV